MSHFDDKNRNALWRMLMRLPSGVCVYQTFYGLPNARVLSKPTESIHANVLAHCFPARHLHSVEQCSQTSTDSRGFAMKTRFSLFCMFFIFSSVSVIADEATEVMFKHLDRSKFFSRVYEYSIDYTEVAKGSILQTYGEGVWKGHRTLYVGHFDSDSWTTPIRVEHFSDDHDEPYLPAGDALMAWEAFAQGESRLFRRVLFGRGGNRIEHDGFVNGGSFLQCATTDLFVIALFALTTELQRFGGVQLPRPKYEEGLIVSSEKHQSMGELLRIANRDGSSFVLYSPSPEYHFIDSTLSATKVTSLKTFDGVVYPGSGTFSTQICSGSFELTSVRPLPDDFSSWFTDWPRGTVVSNQVDGSVTRIPYNEEETEKIRLFFEGPLAADSAFTARKQNYLMYVNAAIATSLFSLFLLRKRLSKETR